MPCGRRRGDREIEPALVARPVPSGMMRSRAFEAVGIAERLDQIEIVEAVVMIAGDVAIVAIRDRPGMLQKASQIDGLRPSAFQKRPRSEGSHRHAKGEIAGKAARAGINRRAAVFASIVKLKSSRSAGGASAKASGCFLLYV